MRSCLVLALVALALLCAPLPAAAHAVLVDSTIPAGAALETVPETVTLRFSETLDPKASRLFLYDEGSMEIGLDQPRFPDATSLEQALPATLRPGSYTLVYQVLSTADGHTTAGSVLFSVGTGVAPVPFEVPKPTETTVGVGRSIARTVQLLGAMAAVGGFFWLGLFLHPLRTSHADTVLPLMRLTVRGIQAGLLGISVGTLWEFLLRLTDLGGGELRLGSVDLFWSLATSQWGGLAITRIVISALLAPIAMLAPHHPTNAHVGAGLGTLMLLTWSASGHAAAVANPLFPVFADWSHGLTAAIWFAGVLGLAAAAWRARHTGPAGTTLLALLVPRFSLAALGTMALIIVTGAFRAVEHLTAIADLWTSDYGLILLLKLSLLAGALLLGGWHWRRVSPRLATEPELAAQFARTILIESVLAVGIVLAVGVLVQTPHPVRASVSAGGAAPSLLPTPTPLAPLPTTLTANVDGLALSLALDDTRPGSRTLTAQISETGALITPDLVRVRFESLDIPTGQQLAELAPQPDGSFQATTTALALVGRWELTLVVRRLNQPDVTAAWIVEIQR